MNKNQLNPVEQYYRERDERIESYKHNKQLNKSADHFIKELAYARYTSNFTWLGRPVIQMPQDLVAMQEIIWATKPDFIIETGIAHGGSLIFYASMLELIGGNGKVIGIDIDIRQHNRVEIEKHPLYHRIVMIEGSSVDEHVLEQVKLLTTGAKRTIVCLDSNHTHDHVLAELNAYAPLVSIGEYCVVFDTGIEDLPEQQNSDRPWGKGNNPKTAVWEYLKTHPEFEIDKGIEHRLLITSASDGYLKRVR